MISSILPPRSILGLCSPRTHLIASLILLFPLPFGQLLQERVSPTIDDVRQYVAIHDTGVNILCSPCSPEIAEKIGSSQVDRLLAAVRRYYLHLFALHQVL